MSITRENTETIDRYVTTGHVGVSLEKEMVIMVKIFTIHEDVQILLKPSIM